MSAGDVSARRYRFGEPDRTGWILGLGGTQCIALAIGIGIGGMLLSARQPLPVVLLPLAVGAVYAFGRIGGLPAHEWLPVTLIFAVRRALGRTTWEARLPLFTGRPADGQGEPELPPCLAGIVLRDVPAPAWAGPERDAVAVVEDRTDRGLSATLRVRGRAFCLLDPLEQDRLVAGWGDALGALSTEGRPVAFVRWSEWSAPVGLDEHLHHLDAHRAAPTDAPAVQAYRELLVAAGREATGHEVLLTVTVDTRRLRRPPGHRTRGSEPELAVLLEELRLLTARLEAAGLDVDPPLSPVELAEALRRRFDPGCRRRLPTTQPSLAVQAGLVSAHNAGPLRTVEHKRSFEVDGAFHRGYVVTEWPRFDVPANWLEPLLLHAGGVRTVSVTTVPVPPSRSARQVKRESTRLASDAELRDAKGFRVSARHRRAEAAVADREAELAAGHAELEHLGLVVVTAFDSEQLESSCAEWEQVAAQAGLELAPLDGRHDLALAAVLPLGRHVPTRSLA